MSIRSVFFTRHNVCLPYCLQYDEVSIPPAQSAGRPWRQHRDKTNTIIMLQRRSPIASHAEQVKVMAFDLMLEKWQQQIRDVFCCA